MTIKIIREGEIPEEQTYVAYCKHCKCLFEYQDGDVIDLRGYHDNFYVICPTCRRNVIIFV